MSPPGRPVAVTVVADAREVWGSERSMLQLAPALTNLGVELTLASPPDAPFAEAWRGLGLPHRPLPLRPQQGVRARPDAGYRPPAALAREAGTTLATTAAIARATAGADVIHSNNVLVHPACALAGRLTGRPAVLEFHDLVPPGLGRTMLTAATRLAGAAIAISAATGECVSPAVRHKVHRIPQAVDTDRFRPGPPDPVRRREWGAEPGVPLVGVVGRVDPEKRVLDVVRAVAALPAPAAVVVVGGPGQDDGGYLAAVRAAGEQLPGRRFHYAGPTEDVPATLRCLDVLVNAAPAEPFGLSVLEAQACGVPVVAARGGGLPDFVHHERTGLLFAPGDVAGLAGALTRVLQDAGLRRRLVEQARRQVVGEHSVAARADRIAALYRRAAAGRGARTASGSRVSRSSAACTAAAGTTEV